MARLTAAVRRAIRCGPVPKLRNWRRLPIEQLTRGERLMKFCEAFLVQPEGDSVGRPFKFEPFQEAFVLAVYDNPAGTHRAYLSIARKNGKTAFIAALVIAHLVGPEAIRNSRMRSGAQSLDQASEVYNYVEKMINESDALRRLCVTKPGYKMATGLARNVTYRALAAGAKQSHGGSPRVMIFDEVGQIVGPTDKFVDAMETAQGAYESALMFAISTQAASPADLFSLWLDDAERSKDPHIVSHVYEAPEGCKLGSRRAWSAANPALGIFRSERDMKTQHGLAARMPSRENKFRNLNLNQRVAADGLFISASVWAKNRAAPRMEVFRAGPVACGLDLSKRSDLTAAVLAASDDDGYVHLLPLVFTPRDGIVERAARDGAPYDQWAEAGALETIRGPVIDYDEMLKRVQKFSEEQLIVISHVEFDPWRSDVAKAAAARVGFAPLAEWSAVGQGFKSMSPRIEAFSALLLNRKIRHGGHPLLTMAAANAIEVTDPAGNAKLDKSKSTQRIDPLVAAVMGAYPVGEGGTAVPFDPGALIG